MRFLHPFIMHRIHILSSNTCQKNFCIVCTFCTANKIHYNVYRNNKSHYITKQYRSLSPWAIKLTNEASFKLCINIPFLCLYFVVAVVYDEYWSHICISLEMFIFVLSLSVMKLHWKVVAVWSWIWHLHKWKMFPWKINVVFRDNVNNESNISLGVIQVIDMLPKTFSIFTLFWLWYTKMV